MTRRQCTGEYKVKPIKQKVRELLGYPYPARIPKGVFVEHWVGISTDEFHRAKDADVKYMRNRHPLLDMSWSRADCARYLTSLGLADTPKSSCLGCPFHGNAQWRHIRDTSPSEWADVVEFDTAIRQGNARANATGNRLLGEAFLHRSRVPLSEAPPSITSPPPSGPPCGSARTRPTSWRTVSRTAARPGRAGATPTR
ncbi:hypothetical protein GCM10020256_11410 [Streptomyces thermocoprophilus]